MSAERAGPPLGSYETRVGAEVVTQDGEAATVTHVFTGMASGAVEVRRENGRVSIERGHTLRSRAGVPSGEDRVIRWTHYEAERRVLHGLQTAPEEKPVECDLSAFVPGYAADLARRAIGGETILRFTNRRRE